MHKFDPKNMARLESEERRKKMPPDVILKKIGISSGVRVADIGCGIGFFSIPASKIVAPDAQAWDQFGNSVSISGDYVIVGAFGEDGGAGDPLNDFAGAAYIYYLHDVFPDE